MVDKCFLVPIDVLLNTIRHIPGKPTLVVKGTLIQIGSQCLVTFEGIPTEVFYALLPYSKEGGEYPARISLDAKASIIQSPGTRSESLMVFIQQHI